MDSFGDLDPKTGKRYYGSWAGNPRGVLEDPACCQRAVYPNERGAISRQCGRKRGFGPKKNLCKQHAEESAKRAARDEQYAAIRHRDDARQAYVERVAEALGVPLSAVYFNYGPSRGWHYTTKVEIEMDHLLGLLGRLDLRSEE